MKNNQTARDFKWVFWALLIVALSVGVILLTGIIEEANRGIWVSPAEITFSVATEEDVDLTGVDLEGKNIKSMKKGFDENGTLVAYIVKSYAKGYHGDVVVVSTISADGKALASIKVTAHDETEYIGDKIDEPSFQNQFSARWLPVKFKGEVGKASEIDCISGSTYSSTAVLNAVNYAYEFVGEYISEK